MTELESSITSDNTTRIRRRSRTCFTKAQLDELESTFNKTPYPDSSTRQKLVKIINIEEQIIQIWFKNRRAKQRRTQKIPLDETSSHASYGYQTDQNLSISHFPQSPLAIANGNSSRCSGIYQPNNLNHLFSNGYFTFNQMYSAYNQFGQNQGGPHPQYVFYNSPIDPRMMSQRTSNSFQNSQNHPIFLSNDVHQSYISLDDKENVDH